MIFILGLDGLEYDLVEKWDLTELKQKEYGKLIVPIDSMMNVPSTPTVWYQFLTGVEVDVKRHVPPLLRLLRKIKLFIEKSGICLSFGLSSRTFKVPLRTPTLKHKTFLDSVSSIKINMLYYNFKNEIDLILRHLADKTITLYTAKYLVYYVYERRKYELFKRLKDCDYKNVDMVFAYLHFPDSIQHLSYMELTQIRRHYENLVKVIFGLKSILPYNTVFIIVSDHGFDFEKKTHSTFGFYSSNITLSPKPIKITDFFNIFGKLRFSK